MYNWINIFSLFVVIRQGGRKGGGNKKNVKQSLAKKTIIFSLKLEKFINLTFWGWKAWIT